jgi:hypothetical protein
VEFGNQIPPLLFCATDMRSELRRPFGVGRLPPNDLNDIFADETPLNEADSNELVSGVVFVLMALRLDKWLKSHRHEAQHTRDAGERQYKYKLSP